MSLKSEKEMKTCSKYSARDETGFVHCHECPLVVDAYNLMCKANSHYDKHKKQWVIDKNYEREQYNFDILEPET